MNYRITGNLIIEKINSQILNEVKYFYPVYNSNIYTGYYFREFINSKNQLQNTIKLLMEKNKA